ncbi:hypothetical protein VTK73DRAFT_9743 [Phialemonium thermophilum]|uniref:Zn(2)-C6 fungal-type domain-containing protein n=1 Tax=Phialemonium thermophilum TaxID=223376 RepID=A0ABR3W0K1_9PEZI
MDEDSPPAKRVRQGKRTSCERCRRRKQACDGLFPSCRNCSKAGVPCVPPERSPRLERNDSGVPPPLEATTRLARTPASSESQAGRSPSISTQQQPRGRGTGDGLSPSGTSHEKERECQIADAVGFLCLGGEQSYVGSSSGYALAVDLGAVIQATVWNKIRPPSSSPPTGEEESKPRDITPEDLVKNAAGPPNDEMGERILQAYLTRIHPLYPFMDRNALRRYHDDRFRAASSGDSEEQQFGTFKIYMVYAIGSQLLRMTESYDYIQPERFFLTAFRHISAARGAHSIRNVEAMTLLAIYHLRSPSNTGIWYLVGMAMRSCVDLGLHREAYYDDQAANAAGDMFRRELTRRLFWTVYSLERHLSISFGRPFSVTDRTIDARLPLDIDDDVRDPMALSHVLNQSHASDAAGRRAPVVSSLTMGIHLIRLKQIESRIYHKIYRADRTLTSLVPKIEPLMQTLREWRAQLPSMSPVEIDYPMIQYNKSIRLLLQPFLSILDAHDARIRTCLEASGQICQIYKRLHSSYSYGHSFIALHSIFVAGITMCYCLWIAPTLWSLQAANDLRAFSSVVHIIAERAPAVRKYRDALEELVNATMEHISLSVPRVDVSHPAASETVEGVCSPRSTLHPNSAYLQVNPATLSQFCEGDDSALQMLYRMTNVGDEDAHCDERPSWAYGGSTGPYGELDQFYLPPQDQGW